jgi:hypothetical protein
MQPIDENEEYEAALLEAERRGLVEKVRDQHGNVVTRPGPDGRPLIVFRRTALSGMKH